MISNIINTAGSWGQQTAEKGRGMPQQKIATWSQSIRSGGSNVGTSSRGTLTMALFFLHKSYEYDANRNEILITQKIKGIHGNHLPYLLVYI